MTPQTTKLEERMRTALTKDLDADAAKHLDALYTIARCQLLDNILPHTVVENPQLTDHTASHVIDVLNQANRLISPDALEGEPPRLSAVDGYVLCLAVLIHDAGMVYGRKGHERRIADIYDWMRGSSERPNQEKTLMHWIAGAHTGETDAGTKDKIAEVPNPLDLDGERVQARELAAILRFADELAEGPHRTSHFVRDQLGLPADSEIFHEYSDITTIHIDRQLGRIALTYNFELDEDTLDSVRFRELLTVVSTRVIKVDRERRYTRYYSQQLDPFRQTAVQLNFWHKGQLIDFDPLELSDKGALDQSIAHLGEVDVRYGVNAIVDYLKERWSARS